MAHAPSTLFKMVDRGFIREGFKADLVVVAKRDQLVERSGLLYKCGWSPFEGQVFSYTVDKTFVNGNLVWDDGKIIEAGFGERLAFKGME